MYANSTAKLACDDWVTQKAVKYVELTQRGTGYSADEGSRTAAFEMKEDAYAFAGSMALGFVRLGISQGQKMSGGLAYTGLDAQHVRTDPDNSALEQPKFKRGQWDGV